MTGHAESGPPAATDLDAVLLHASDAITVQRPDGSLVYANLAAARVLGYESPAALLATPLRELMSHFQLIDEDGAPLPLERLPSRRAMAGEGPASEVVRFRTVETGEEHWSLVQAMPVINPDGSLRLVINTFQDVTDLKRSEQRLRLLADAGAVLGRSVDYQQTLQELAEMVVPEIADWCVVDVLEGGPPYRRVAIAHADPAKLRLAEEIERRYPADPERRGGVADVVRTGEPLLVPDVTPEMLRESAQDEEHASLLDEADIASVAIVPLVARGMTLGAMTLIGSRGSHHFGRGDLPLLEELARRAALAVDNSRLLHEANESVRLRDDFLAMASHDMRTPLAVILTNIQLARRRLSRRDADLDDIVRHLESAERTTQKMTGLVGELMDISMLRSRQGLPLDIQDVDLVALAATAVEEHQKLTERHHLELAAPEALVGRWDPMRVERVLRNILENALKYSPGGGDITVRIRREDDGAWATIAVSDQGVGIPADELPNLFEKFHRGSNTRELRGTGLGLAGSKMVVEQLGGTISVESTLDEGSTFTVRLPLGAAPR